MFTLFVTDFVLTVARAKLILSSGLLAYKYPVVHLIVIDTLGHHVVKNFCCLVSDLSNTYLAFGFDLDMLLAKLPFFI